MRRFFTLLSLLCIVGTSLVVSDLYRADAQSTKSALSDVNKLRNNPYYTGVIGIQAFPMEESLVSN